MLDDDNDAEAGDGCYDEDVMKIMIMMMMVVMMMISVVTMVAVMK